MMKRFAALLALAVATAATAAVAAPPPNPFNDRLQKLDDARRNGVLRRAVLDSNMVCGNVKQSLQRGRYKNLIMWAVRCVPSGDYAVYVGPDGSVQVRDCAEARELRLPTCNLPPR